MRSETTRPQGEPWSDSKILSNSVGSELITGASDTSLGGGSATRTITREKHKDERKYQGPTQGTTWPNPKGSHHAPQPTTPGIAHVARKVHVYDKGAATGAAREQEAHW